MLTLPPAGTMYSRVLPGNGIVAESVTGLEIYAVKAGHIATFAVLVNAGHNVKLHDIEVSDSRRLLIRNGATTGTGGLALEEGTSDLRDSSLPVRWVARHRHHASRGRTRNVIDNEFAVLAHDGIRVSESKAVTIGSNNIRQIGFPRKR